MSAISHKRTIVFPIPPPGKTNGVCLGRRRWLRRRPPAAPRWTPAPGRARSGAGRARSGLGGGIVGGRFPAHTFSNFSDRSQGHTRRGTRGGGFRGGVPPCRRFHAQRRTRKDDRRLVGRDRQRPSGRRSTSHQRPIFSVPCYPGVTRTPFSTGTPR